MSQTAFGADSNGREEFRPYHRSGDPDWHPSQVVLTESAVEDVRRDAVVARAEHLAIVAAVRAELKRQGRI